MQDYSITKCTRKCAVSGRGLEPGENYFSVILADGDDVSRIDIAASEWKGPREDAIGWWRSKMPAAASKKVRPAPNGVLLDTLSDLLERQGKEPLAYLLALLLIRRRVLQESQTLDSAHDPTHPLSATHWRLVCPADGREWHVPLEAPRPEMLEQLQAELKGLLFTDE